MLCDILLWPVQAVTPTGKRSTNVYAARFTPASVATVSQAKALQNVVGQSTGGNAARSTSTNPHTCPIVGKEAEMRNYTRLAALALISLLVGCASYPPYYPPAGGQASYGGNTVHEVGNHLNQAVDPGLPHQVYKDCEASEYRINTSGSEKSLHTSGSAGQRCKPTATRINGVNQ